MKSLLFVIETWIERMIFENMGWACKVASMSEHLRFDSRRTNLRKLGEMNIVYSKIRSDHKVVTVRIPSRPIYFNKNCKTYLRE